ncbi:MAG TPA: hypothetical protein VNO50_22995 [Pyrinomonadaceae bacterium]|nr:hypothetical protein [Pyrinomonadaceae bacterium]
MKRSRGLLVFLIGLFVVAAAWLWWVKPRQVDMAAHAPANSILYLEANSPAKIAQSLQNTEAWKLVHDLAGTEPEPLQSSWLQELVAWTGIGPVESVILARAQVAVVVTDLGATEDSDTLRIKPEGALIIETKTSERRIRPVIDNAARKLAEITYGKPELRSTNIDGFDFSEWVSPDGTRQIVVVVVGSLVIIGNTRRAVQSCLAVKQRGAPSLKDDAELSRIRFELRGNDALTFGYVPPGNSAKLLSIGVPLLMGRAPVNSEFQRLVTSGASKVFGSLAWTSRPFRTGIEDRFLISLQPQILARLKPVFTSARVSSDVERIVPADVTSITFYKFENPSSVWHTMKSSISSQIDALSAVVFTSLFNSSLGSYGIDDPESFLSTTSADIITFRIDQNAERSLLVARVKDEAKLRELLAKTMRIRSAGPAVSQVEILVDTEGETAASFVRDFIVMGSPAEVLKYAQVLSTGNPALDPDKFKKAIMFAPLTSSANILTYTDDSDRVRNFFSAAFAAQRVAPVPRNRMDQLLSQLPYAATETTLGERGIERTTVSPLGQFSTLLPLLIPTERSPSAP